MVEQYIPANRFGFNLFNAGVAILPITNGNILNLTTVAGTSSTTSLEGMIRAKTVPEQYVPLREQIADAMVRMKDIGTLTNTNVAAADTVAGMRTLFSNQDASLSGAAYITFAFPV